MPGMKRSKKPVSKAQARMFGAIAGGAKTKAKGMSRAEAKRKMSGVKQKKLPARANNPHKGGY